mmetsp:Transcript_155941/g.498331  ORF Transcript_155941/g.498331 Transcript_155941/m.498331 type:complete len:436 (+) Transcript_155941:2977-4284(+)
MVVVHLPQATAEHDGFHPLEALTRLKPVAEVPSPAADKGLAELVSIIAGTIRAVDQDLQRGRHGRRVQERLVFPWHFVPRDVQVAHCIACNGGNNQGALPGACAVTDAATSTRLGARERGDAAREVVCLDGECHVEVPLGFHVLARHCTLLRELLRKQGCVPEAAQSTAVVVERDGAVGGVLHIGTLDPLEESHRHGLSIDDDLATEEPMPAVLRVALSQVEALDLRGVALEVVAEHFHVVVDILGVVAETIILAQFFESGPALREDGHGGPLGGLLVLVERLDAAGVGALGHAVVHEGHELRKLRDLVRVLDVVAAGLLDACDLDKANGVADRHSVRGPSAGELLPGADLNDAVPTAAGRQEGGRCAIFGRKGLAQQILQLGVLVGGQSLGCLNVVADLTGEHLEADIRRLGLERGTRVQVCDSVDVQHRHRVN